MFGTITATAWEDQELSSIFMFLIKWEVGAYTFELIASEGTLRLSECVFDDDETRGQWTRIKDLPTEAAELYRQFIAAPDTPTRVNSAIDVALGEIIDRYEAAIADLRATARAVKLGEKAPNEET